MSSCIRSSGTQHKLNSAGAHLKATLCTCVFISNLLQFILILCDIINGRHQVVAGQTLQLLCLFLLV